MSSFTSVPATSTTVVTSVSSVVTDLVSGIIATPVSTKKKKTKATRTPLIPAGSSVVPSSSSLFVDSASGVSLVPASSVSPQYKTVYVTKTAEPNSNAPSSDLPPGAIAGIAVGGVAVLTLIIGLVYFLLRRRRKKVLESSDASSTSGSQTTVVGKKSEGDMSELYGTRDQPMYEANSFAVYEMEASVPELDGRTFSLESVQSPMSEAAARHIMSRGRPIKRDKG
jgi:hypothetical protein